jgi:hypothetical protein
MEALATRLGVSRHMFFVLLGFLVFFIPARADVLFYAGDFDPSFWYSDSLSNENDAYVYGNPYGSAVYQNFIIPSGETWNVSSLFSNDIMSVNPTSIYWEIRTGLSEGNGGTLLASGAGSDSYHLKNQYQEYTNTVSALNLTLQPGMYWLTVVPEAPGQQGRSYNTNTFGRNAIGMQESDEQYFNSPFFDFSFTNADNIGMFPRFSDGVIGNIVPEPSSLVMLVTGALAVVAGLKRRT